MRIVDSHTHIGRYGDWDCPLPRLLALMDSNGVDRAVVGCMESNELGAGGFEEGLRKIEGHQDRLRLMLWVNPARPGDAAEAEAVLKRWRTQIACIKVHPQTAQVPLGDERYLPYLRLCEETGLPLVAHTEPGEFASADALAAMARENPDVRFVAVHMELRGDHGHVMDLVARHTNLYGDTTFLPVADVRRAIDRCGAEKILFGSDAPILEERYREKLSQMTAVMTEAEQRLVFAQNAEKVFDLGSCCG